MPKNKQVKGISWKTVFGILGSIAFLVGAIVNGLDFINYLREGYQQFLRLGIAFLGVIWLIVLWLLFKQRNIYGILWLAVTVISGPVIWNGWQSFVQTREDKLVVLVARFDGPEEVYGLRNEILEKLNTDFANDSDVQVESVSEVITPETDSGSSRARKLGEKLQADVVIWGWYRRTENPNITIHIENLSTTEITIINDSEVYQPESTLADLETFKIQKKLGSETSTLLSFVTGVIKFKSGEYLIAIERFEQVLEKNDVSTFINANDIFFYLGSSYYQIGDFPSAIQDYDKAIELNPYDAGSYNNRGVVYQQLEEYERAIQDYDRAIELDIRDAGVYNNRGVAYDKLGQYERAIQDYDRAIELDIQDAGVYNNRGLSFFNLKRYERAIQDYDRAIEINPQHASAYFNRGAAYYKLGQYEHAIQDYDKAIELKPQYVGAYNNRGVAYVQLEQYEQAFHDFNKAIEINPQYADAYYNRGVANKNLGRTLEADIDFKKYEELTGKK